MEGAFMQVAGLNLEDLRREEEIAKRDWEEAVRAVRAANDAVSKAHQRYLQAWKAATEATPRTVPILLPRLSSNKKGLEAPASSSLHAQG
jgi:hypothetical protein